MTSGPTDVQSVAHEMEMAANASKTISTCPNKPKLPDSPSQRAGWAPDKSNGHGNCTDMSSACRDTYRIAYDADTAENAQQNVSMCPTEPKRPNPPTKGTNGCANEMDTSSHHPGTLNMRTHMISPADKVGNIKTCQIGSRMPDLPGEGTRRTPHGKALNRVHGVNSPSRQHGRPKIEWINISKLQMIKMAYLWCVDVTQPCRNASNQVHGVYRPSRR